MTTRRTVLACVGFSGLLVAGLLTTACPEGDGEGGDSAKKVKSIAELPGPVRDTLALFAPAKAKPESMEREEENGVVTWSAEYELDKGDLEVTALSNGTLVSIERESRPSALPREVVDASKEVLGMKPKEADHVRLAVYELEDRPQEGTVRERFVDPFGRIVLQHIHVASPEESTPEAVADLPAAVRATLDKKTGGAELTGLHVEKEWGRTVHAASWHAADGPREIKILEDGRILYLELTTGPLPAGVAAMIEEGAGYPEAATETNENQAGEATAESSSEGEQELVEEGGSEEAEGHAGHAASSAGVERMLLDAWEVRGNRDGHEVEALILETGKILTGTGSGTPEGAAE